MLILFWVWWTLPVWKPQDVLLWTATVAKLIPIVLFSTLPSSSFPVAWARATSHLSLQLESGTNLFSSISSTAVYIFYGFIGFETMSIVAGEMRNPEKNVPRAILGSISIVSVLTCWSSQEQSPCLVVALCKLVHQYKTHLSKWLALSELPLFHGALISIAGLNIGESIMVPRFGAALATENSLPEGLEKQTLRMPPVIAIIISGIPAFFTLCYLALFESLATFSVVSVSSNTFQLLWQPSNSEKCTQTKRLPSECHLVLLSQF